VEIGFKLKYLTSTDYQIYCCHYTVHNKRFHHFMGVGIFEEHVLKSLPICPSVCTHQTIW